MFEYINLFKHDFYYMVQMITGNYAKALSRRKSIYKQKGGLPVAANVNNSYKLPFFCIFVDMNIYLIDYHIFLSLLQKIPRRRLRNGTSLPTRLPHDISFHTQRGQYRS